MNSDRSALTHVWGARTPKEGEFRFPLAAFAHAVKFIFGSCTRREVVVAGNLLFADYTLKCIQMGALYI